MKGLVAFVSLLVLTGVAACQREEAAGPFEISGRLVVFNYRVARATLLVTLRRIAPVADGAEVVAEFDDPADGPPVGVRRKVFPAQDQIALETGPVHCIVKDRPYKVAIRVTGRDGQVLQTLSTTVTSNQDQSVLPADPLVVGPLYDPNPKVFRSDGSRDFSPEKGCPAASK